MIHFVDLKNKLNYYRYTLSSINSDIYQKLIKNKNLYKKYEDNIFIDRLYFEVTNICNAKCIFCAYKTAEHKKGVMSFSIFKKAIDEYAALGGKSVSFTPTVGDPLIDPGLIEKIRYAVKLSGIKQVYFYTNGILLNNSNKYKELVDSGINEISISVGDLDKETYAKVYGVDMYDKVISGVFNLLKYNKECGEKIKINIAFRTSKKPSETISSNDFIKYIKPFLSNNVKYSFMPDYDNWGGEIKSTDLLGTMKMRRVNKVKLLPCIRTFDAAILFDGSVRLCACRLKKTEFDELVVGNINQDSLKNIFYGENTKNFRERFTDSNLPPVCQDCSLYKSIDKKWLKNRTNFHKKILNISNS